MEGDRTPNEAPTNRLVLAQEDLDRIATAIRDGLGKEPPDGKKLLWDVVKVLGAFGLLVLVYFVLTHWRPAVDISVRADALSTPQVLTHGPDESAVDWSVGAGQVRALTVDELPPAEQSEADQFMISLPIPGAECAEVAATLDATCDGDVIEVQPPVTVAWSDPQILQLDRPIMAEGTPSEPGPVPQLRLDLQQPGANQPGMTREATESDEESESQASSPPPKLTIDDRQAVSQHWYFSYQPAGGAASLSITGGNEGYERSFEPASAPDVDSDALRLRVVPGNAARTDDPQGAATAAPRDGVNSQAGEPRPASTVVTLSGISSLDVTTSSRHLSASALTGSLTLLQDTTVLEGAATTGFAGDAITSELEIRTGTPSLAISGTGVTSLDTDRGNLVSTVWQRHSDLALPIFIGVVGVFTPLLGTVYRNGVDYLANRRLPSGPRKRS